MLYYLHYNAALAIQCLHCLQLTIILQNRAEYHPILSPRGRRPSWLKLDNIPQDRAG